MLIEAELKLGVGNDDAFGQRKRGGFLINLDADFLDLRGQIRPDDFDDLFVADVLVVLATAAFAAGVKIGSGSWLAFFSPAGKGTPQTDWLCWYSSQPLPAR